MYRLGYVFMTISALAGVGGGAGTASKSLNLGNKIQVKLDSNTHKFGYNNKVGGGFGICVAISQPISCTFSSTKTAAYFTSGLGYDSNYPPVNTLNIFIPIVNYPTTDQEVYR